MIHRKLLVASAALIGFLASSAPAARADEVYTFVIKKQEEKQKHGWYLSDWLETKEKMRLMDLWLALHSPSPYEFFVGGDYRWANPDNGPRQTAWHFDAAAYASIFGLEFQRDFPPIAQSTYLFDFRIFGFAAQGTNITLQAGVRDRENLGGDFRSAVTGASMTVYLTRFAGVDALWRHAFDSVPSANGSTVRGNRYEAGGFIDFRALRIYGTWFSEPEGYDTPTGSVSVTTHGAFAGARLFF